MGELLVVGEGKGTTKAMRYGRIAFVARRALYEPPLVFGTGYAGSSPLKSAAPFSGEPRKTTREATIFVFECF